MKFHVPRAGGYAALLARRGNDWRYKLDHSRATLGERLIRFRQLGAVYLKASVPPLAAYPRKVEIRGSSIAGVDDASRQWQVV